MLPFPLHLLMDCFETWDAVALRLVDRGMLDAVTNHEWNDLSPVRNIAPWRASFPHAKTLAYLGDEQVYFPQRLRILYIQQFKVFSRAFRRMKQLRVISLRACRGVGRALPYFSRLVVVDLSFSRFAGANLCHLRSVTDLTLQGCKQVLNDDLAPLKTITRLDISETDGIDVGLMALPQLRHLRMNGAQQAVNVLCWLTLESLCANNIFAHWDWMLPKGMQVVCLNNVPGHDKRLEALVGACTVDLSDTDFDRLTPLQGVCELALRAASLRGLRDLWGPIRVLDISNTRAHPPSTFGHFTHIHRLVANQCHWLDAESLQYVGSIDALEMKCVLQPAVAMRRLCERLGVRTVYTCACSSYKFKFENGPVVSSHTC